MKRALLVALLFACAPRGHWPPRPAEHPATLRELQAYELTVYAPDPQRRDEFARALSGRGFHIVDHDPGKLQLDVTLSREGDLQVATMRSDGWFVDEAVGADPETLARTLALSQRIADFIRNSGLPQQHMAPDK